MGITVPFPDVLPAGYEWFEAEPAFDPNRHLALEVPTSILMLTELGYSEAEIANKATAVAASAPFRLLSPEGAEIMLSVARRLRDFAHPAGDRIECMTRGGCYRSRWLRDLCISPDATNHLSTIYGIEVVPHAMPAHLGHINFEPKKINTAIDKWHHDTLALDYVLMVTDPAAVPGGRFEYFTGTKQEAAALAEQGKTPSAERIVAPDFPTAGYAVALHGDMVVHRAAPVTELAERITMVNGYTSMDPSLDDQSRTVDLIPVDDHECLWTEWAKFAAWRSHGRLTKLLEELEFTPDRELVATRLEEAIADAQKAASAMRRGKPEMLHYGG